METLRLIATSSIAVLLAQTLVGCGAPDGSVPKAKPKAAPTSALDSITKMAPEDARLNLASDPFLAPASELATFKVPTLNLIGFDTQLADYAQIARCEAGTTLKNGLGEDVETVMKQPDAPEKLKWIWFNQVFSRVDKCKVVGGSETQIARQRYQDLSAPTGEFFYVINPCILALRSTKKESCSYRLIITKTVKNENALTAQFLDYANRLATAESYLGGLYSQLYFDTQAIRFHKEGCEASTASNQARQNFWKGLVGLSIGGIGATIGGIMSGGTAALSGFRTGIGLATSLFKRVPPVPDICPAVDTLVSHSQKISGELDGALENVISLRLKLGELDKRYGELDAAILKR